METAAPATLPPHGLTGLFDLHRHALRRFLEAHCGNPAEAEDLLQDLWIKLATTATGPVGNGRAYLFRMANNLAIDHFRSRRQALARQASWLESMGQGAGPPEEQPDPAPGAEQQLADEQETAALAAAILALPAGSRRALTLYRLEGLGQAEVARAMGISKSGVEKHLAAAMRHLREFFRARDQIQCEALAMPPSHGKGTRSALELEGDQ